MNNKVITFIGIALVIIGTIIGCIFNSDVAAITSFAVAAFGAGLAAANIWSTRKKEAPTWVVIVGIVLIGLGAFVAGFVGIFSESQLVDIIGYVIAIVMLLGGIFTVAFTKPKEIKADK